MPNEEQTKLRLQIAHVRFIDVVGYSKLSIRGQGFTARRPSFRNVNEFISAEVRQKNFARVRNINVPCDNETVRQNASPALHTESKSDGAA